LRRGWSLQLDISHNYLFEQLLYMNKLWMFLWNQILKVFCPSYSLTLNSLDWTSLILIKCVSKLFQESANWMNSFESVKGTVEAAYCDHWYCYHLVNVIRLTKIQITVNELLYVNRKLVIVIIRLMLSFYLRSKVTPLSSFHCS
jgi:hypothetical protein